MRVVVEWVCMCACVVAFFSSCPFATSPELWFFFGVGSLKTNSLWGFSDRVQPGKRTITAREFPDTIPRWWPQNTNLELHTAISPVSLRCKVERVGWRSIPLCFILRSMENPYPSDPFPEARTFVRRVSVRANETPSSSHRMHRLPPWPRNKRLWTWTDWMKIQ